MNKRPVVLVVMDGVGESDNLEGNAVKNAYTPNLDYLKANYPEEFKQVIEKYNSD